MLKVLKKIAKPRAKAKGGFGGDDAAYRERQERISEAAYYLAASRGFEAGHEMEDWYKAVGMMEEGEG